MHRNHHSSMRSLVKQIPNILTTIRVPVSIACAYFTFQSDYKSLIIAFVLFSIATATDYFDGYLARLWKIESNFGKLLDPIADKVLILGILAGFSYTGLIPWFITIIIAFREILLTVFRLILVNRPKKEVLQAISSGKLKTASQMGAIGNTYLLLLFEDQLSAYVSHSVIHWIIFVMIGVAAILTVYSGIEFYRVHQRQVDSIFE